MNIQFRTIPESFKIWYNENKDTFNSTMEFTFSDEDMQTIVEVSEENNVELELTLHYFLLRTLILLEMEQEEHYSFGMLYFDFELYSEDEISEMIEEAQRILIFDEKCQKVSVLLSVAEYEKFKELEANQDPLTKE